jgi:flagellar protein FlgJ
MSTPVSSSLATTANANINALDFRGLADIQRQAKSNDPKALKAAAQQFEALFLQMVLKSMRDATPKEGMFDSDQSRMYESLLDSQLSQVLSSKKGVGLADALARQMTRQTEAASTSPDGDVRQMMLELFPNGIEFPRGRTFNFPPPPGTNAVSPAPTSGLIPGTVAPAGPLSPPANAREFISRVLPDATVAAQETGIPAAFLIAHAALETGWGRSEPKGADGRASHNLFGIKAGRSWGGDSVDSTTTEFVQGVSQRRVERFRAYDSYTESFRDYANLLTTNPRYAGVLGAQDAGRFARGLQAAGYATDPHYAAKLERVIGSVSMPGVAAG